MIGIDLDKARFVLSGPDWEPAGDAWRLASPASRRGYWKQVGMLAMQAKRSELQRGLGVDGDRLQPVKPRKGRGDGPPLTPHRELSRFRKWLRMVATPDHVTLFWSHGWARIVTYHALRRGRRTLPVRDVVGLTDASQVRVARQARAWWYGRNPEPATILEYLKPGQRPRAITSGIQVGEVS